MSQATEILYGGAAGGGKSHLMRVCAVAWCMQISGLLVYLFRRISGDLIKNHMEGVGGFREMLAPLMQSGHCQIRNDAEIIFWNGAKIFLCHCQYEKDKYKYQGAEMHVLMVDELTHFSESIYQYLRGRVRLGGLSIPDTVQTPFPRILCGSNPGGVGHAWVKKTFVDYVAPMELKQTSAPEGGMVRQYIPAKLADNPTMTINDPHYADRLEGLGNPALVAAMKDGNWDIIDGAYFADFARDKHVLKPFHIPHHWARIVAFDWGYAAPFAVLWGAVSDGTEKTADGKPIPKNAIVVYREYYGGDNNVGVRLAADEIADEIKRKSGKERFALMVADPAIFAQNGGISIAETMSNRGVVFYPADNKRVAGWQQIQMRLNGTAQSEHAPLLFVFEQCKHLIRTLPELQHDEHKIEDIDTAMEDHAADALRYLCMTRQLATSAPSENERLPNWLAI